MSAMAMASLSRRAVPMPVAASGRLASSACALPARPVPIRLAAAPSSKPAGIAGFHGSSPLNTARGFSLRSSTPRVVTTEATGKEDSPRSSELGETAKANLRNAAQNCRRIGWISFWTQLVLSSVSIVILLFSVAFSNTTNPTVPLYMALFGVLAGFVSTIWAFRYTRMARSISLYLEAKEGLLPPDVAKDVKKISKLEVLRSMNWSSFVNLLGLGTTILGLQATVGGLVAKTLTNATANPFLAAGAGSYNPVLALDVFLIQGLTNTLLSHFAGLVFSMWLARSIDGSTSPSSSSNPQVSFST